MDGSLDGAVALVTGGANGIGAGIARHLAGLGAQVVVADINEELGRTVAKEIGGWFVRCDVSDFADNEAAVAATVAQYGGLQIVALNAGVSTSSGKDRRFDPVAYRRAMAINLDGVMFGAQAARPVLEANGGGDIIVTASIAGLLPTPLDPVYGANKAGAVGLVRALGPAWVTSGVRVNALCPGFADTGIIENVRDMLGDRGIEVMEVDAVVEVFMKILRSEQIGQCWYLLPGLPSAPFEFAHIPDLLSVYPEPSSVRQPAGS